MLSPNHPSRLPLEDQGPNLEGALKRHWPSPPARCTDGETETQKRQGFTQSYEPVASWGQTWGQGSVLHSPVCETRLRTTLPLPPSEYAAPRAQALSDSRAAALGAYGGRAGRSRAPRSPGEGEGVGEEEVTPA